MAKINSRQKGARGERELAHFLTKHGYPARRGQQFSGSPDSPDVVCESLKKFQIECKLVEALNIHKAIAQARGDCGPDQTPVVMHKKNRTGWLCTLPLKDFMDILNGHPEFIPSPKCPQCDSEDIELRHISKRIKIEETNYWKCNYCQSYWQQNKPT